MAQQNKSNSLTEGSVALSLIHILPGCAKRVAQLCKDCGLTLTGAGAAFPYGIDPRCV